jgi:hypothetical protein
MNNSFPRLIDGMCATLRTEVLSRLDDEFARGQVFGVINLLNTFKVRADWSTGFLVQQLDAQCTALNGVRTLLSGVEGAPNIAEHQAPQAPTPAELLAQRDAANREIGTLLAWLSAARPQLPAELAHNVEDRLRLAMRREIEIELKASPRPLFAEMSSGRED